MERHCNEALPTLQPRKKAIEARLGGLSADDLRLAATVLLAAWRLEAGYER